MKSNTTPPPEGNVTFLFVGIKQLTDETAESSLSAADPIEEFINSENGFLLNRTSEAVVCSFSNAIAAVRTAGKILSCSYEVCKESETLALKAGIHGGHAKWNGDNYDSYLAIARSQRIMSAANPGQALISGEVFETLDVSQISSIEFKILGEHFLKDLLKPAKIYQINFPGLNHDFPPLITLSCRPNNIPAQLNNLIGREEIIESIKEDLENSRLVTLTGTGGVGKTRLSLQVAAELIDNFKNGLWFIELASIDSKDRAIQQIASVIGVSEEGETDLLDAVIADSADKEMLIILDNCEHLVRECAEIADRIFKGTKYVKILASSREALNLFGEVIRQIPSLKLPDIDMKNGSERIQDIESVRLFEERAKAVNSRFAVDEKNEKDVAEICIRLDGIPLAIELAAARTTALSPDKILNKLHDRFKILSGGRRTLLPRQQTLRATIDWSYSQLDEKEANMLKSLSIFERSFSLDSAGQISQSDELDEFEVLDMMTSLIDKSLLMKSESDGDTRFYLLESIREYAREKLSDEEHELLLKKLYDYFSEKIIRDSDYQAGDVDLTVLNEFRKDHANILKTIEWAEVHEPSQFVNLTGMLEWYWDNAGYHNEGFRLLENALKVDPDVAGNYRGRALLSAGFFATNLCKYDAAEAYILDAKDYFNETGDEKGVTECYNILGILFTNVNDPERARKSFEMCRQISKDFDDKNLYADSLANLSVIELKAGNYDEALKFSIEAQDIYRKLNKTKALAKTLVNLGALEFYKQNMEESKKRYEEALALLEGLGDLYTLCVNYINMGNIYFNQREFGEAEKYYEKGFRIIREHEFIDMTGFMQLKSGDLALAKKEFDKAAREYDCALESKWIHNDKRKIASIFRGLGFILKESGDLENALLFLLFSDREFTSSGFRLPGFQEEELYDAIRELSGRFTSDELAIIRSRSKSLSETEAIELHKSVSARKAESD